MPRYHLELRNESHVATRLDVDRDDLTELRIEMARFVGELLKDHSDQIWVDEDWRVDVTDDSGLILFVIHISASNMAATNSLRR